MLKYLSIFALLFFVFSVQTYAQTNDAQKTSTDDKPSSPVAPVLPQQNNRPDFQAEQQKHVDADVRIISTPEKDGYDKAAFWINIILAGIGMGGIVAAFLTIRKLERQTKAAEDQTKHMITSERAWIIISSRFPDGLHPGDQDAITRFRWEFKNVGNSPARLLEFDGVAQRADRWNIHFSNPPHFFDRAIPLNKLLLVPNDSYGLTWMIEGDALSVEEFESLKSWGKTTLISYGYVKYLDAFGEEHTTRFCQEFWFDKESKKPFFPPKIEAPASYTDCD